MVYFCKYSKAVKNGVKPDWMLTEVHRGLTFYFRGFGSGHQLTVWEVNNQRSNYTEYLCSYRPRQNSVMHNGKIYLGFSFNRHSMNSRFLDFYRVLQTKAVPLWPVISFRDKLENKFLVVNKQINKITQAQHTVKSADYRFSLLPDLLLPKCLC